MKTVQEYFAQKGVRTSAWARRVGTVFVMVLLAPAVLYLAGLMLLVAWPMLPFVGFLVGSWIGMRLPTQREPDGPSSAELPRASTTLQSFHHAA